MPIVDLDHVQLAMPRGREDEARRFYGVVLELAELPKPSNLARRGGVWFQLGPRQLHLGVEDPFVPAKKAHAAMRVRDLLALKARLAEHGCMTREDEPLPGYHRFYADDPFGNRLEFLEPT